eukprot:scaffold141_cov232-Pinguiococcus_pyrenoidosus.AAC.12
MHSHDFAIAIASAQAAPHRTTLIHLKSHMRLDRPSAAPHTAEAGVLLPLGTLVQRGCRDSCRLTRANLHCAARLQLIEDLHPLLRVLCGKTTRVLMSSAGWAAWCFRGVSMLARTFLLGAFKVYILDFSSMVKSVPSLSGSSAFSGNRVISPTWSEIATSTK